MLTRPVDLLVDAAATYRLTRLVSRDALTQGLRDRVMAYEHRADRDVVAHRHRYGAEIGDLGPLSYFVGCPWCVSVWVGLGVAVARRVVPAGWGLVAAGLAASAATGWLSERE